MNYTFRFGDIFAAWPRLPEGSWTTLRLQLAAGLPVRDGQR